MIVAFPGYLYLYFCVFIVLKGHYFYYSITRCRICLFSITITCIRFGKSQLENKEISPKCLKLWSHYSVVLVLFVMLAAGLFFMFCPVRCLGAVFRGSNLALYHFDFGIVTSMWCRVAVGVILEGHTSRITAHTCNLVGKPRMHSSPTSYEVLNWFTKSENVPSLMCAQRRFLSACAFAQSDQNLHWVQFG